MNLNFIYDQDFTQLFHLINKSGDGAKLLV